MTAAYKYVKRKNHPLSTPSGRIPEHRVVLYDKIGPGPHPCHWCGKQLDWEPLGRTADGVLTVDHVDEDTRNNDFKNLVPSCHTCNVERARDKRFEDAPYLVVQNVRQAAEWRVCRTCGDHFLILSKLMRSGKKRGKKPGRYCSRKCLHRRQSE